MPKLSRRWRSRFANSAVAPSGVFRVDRPHHGPRGKADVAPLLGAEIEPARPNMLRHHRLAALDDARSGDLLQVVLLG